MKTLILLLVCSLAHAETLDYIASPLNFIYTEGSSVSDGITPRDTPASLSGSLTFEGTLGANWVNREITPTSFNFSSELSSDFQNHQPQDHATFLFSTDAQGNITGWNISITDITGGGPANGMRSATINTVDDIYAANQAYSECGQPGFTGCYALTAIATPGTWVVHSIAAPEINPAGGIGAFLLLAGGIAVSRGRRA